MIEVCIAVLKRVSTHEQLSASLGHSSWSSMKLPIAAMVWVYAIVNSFLDGEHLGSHDVLFTQQVSASWICAVSVVTASWYSNSTKTA